MEGTKRFPGSEWLLLEALRVASQDVAEDVTKKRLSYTTFFEQLVILSELSKGKDEDTFHRELDSIEPNSGVVR